MSCKRFVRDDRNLPPRLDKGDRGRIWKCYDFFRNPIGYLVTGGKGGVTPIAYCGLPPVRLAQGTHLDGVYRTPRGGLEFDYAVAVAIAERFDRASTNGRITDLRRVDKNWASVPAFLAGIVLKITGGTSRAVRSVCAGCVFKPLWLPEHKEPVVGLWSTHDARNLPRYTMGRPAKEKRPSTGSRTVSPASLSSAKSPVMTAA